MQFTPEITKTLNNREDFSDVSKGRIDVHIQTSEKSSLCRKPNVKNNMLCLQSIFCKKNVCFVVNNCKLRNNA